MRAVTCGVVLVVAACGPPNPCAGHQFDRSRRYSMPYAGHWGVARGSGALCRAVARLGGPGFAERLDSARRQARRTGASRDDRPVRRRAHPPVIFRPMRGFLVRLLITALGLWVADQLLPGIAITGTRALTVSALLLGIVNAVIRPTILILTLPLTVLTLGLFILIVNGISLELVA